MTRAKERHPPPSMLTVVVTLTQQEFKRYQESLHRAPKEKSDPYFGMAGSFFSVVSAFALKEDLHLKL